MIEMAVVNEGEGVTLLKGHVLFKPISSTIALDVPVPLTHCFIILIYRVEYVTITPDGFRYRSQIFPTVNGLFRWFKDHYHEPVPGTEYSSLCILPSLDV